MTIVGVILFKESLLQLLLRINNYLIKILSQFPGICVTTMGNFRMRCLFNGVFFFLFFEIRISVHFNKGKSVAYSYSRTSRKRPPKMQRLGGRLREVVVVYKNRTIGALFREEVQTHLLYGRCLLHAMSKLRHL